MKFTSSIGFFVILALSFPVNGQGIAGKTTCVVTLLDELKNEVIQTVKNTSTLSSEQFNQFQDAVEKLLGPLKADVLEGLGKLLKEILQNPLSLFNPTILGKDISSAISGVISKLGIFEEKVLVVLKQLQGAGQNFGSDIFGDISKLRNGILKCIGK